MLESSDANFLTKSCFYIVQLKDKTVKYLKWKTVNCCRVEVPRAFFICGAETDEEASFNMLQFC